MKLTNVNVLHVAPPDVCTVYNKTIDGLIAVHVKRKKTSVLYFTVPISPRRSPLCPASDPLTLHPILFCCQLTVKNS